MLVNLVSQQILKLRFSLKWFFIRRSNVDVWFYNQYKQIFVISNGTLVNPVHVKMIIPLANQISCYTIDPATILTVKSDQLLHSIDPVMLNCLTIGVVKAVTWLWLCRCVSVWSIILIWCLGEDKVQCFEDI